MSELRFARSGISTGEKNDCEVKSLVPESLKAELSTLAVLRGMSISEYVRLVLTTHCRGHVAWVQTRANLMGDEGL